MLNRIFPERFDNHYRGHRLALWLFYPITFMNVVIDLVAIFKSDGGAQSADGIPLDTFVSGGAQAVIFAVALLGLSGLLQQFVSVLALLRYRAMIPLMYVLLVVDYLGHKGIAWMKPVVRTGTSSGSYVTVSIFALTFLGLVLSLRGKGYLPAQKAPST
jgi:hypothetical protein